MLYCLVIAGQLFLTGSYENPKKALSFSAVEYIRAHDWGDGFYIEVTTYERDTFNYKVEGALVNDQIPFVIDQCAQKG